jgi:cardiolipin synthase A/B
MTILALHLATLLGGVLMVLLSADILRTRRQPSATWGWLLFMLTLPWLAIPLYLSLGTRKLAPAAQLQSGDSSTDEATAQAGELQRVLASNAIPPAQGGNLTRFHQDGIESLNSLISVIAGAQKYLHLSIYLLANDAAGKRVTDELLRAVQRGVKVRCLLDGVGSFLFPRRRLRELRTAGIDITWFIPLLHRPFRGRNNLRNHRKLAIADGSRAWLGGRNLADEYFADDARWIDLSFEIEGPAVSRLCSIFNADWQFATGDEVRMETTAGSAGSGWVQVVPSGPDTTGEPLHDLLLSSLFQARKRILAVTPYFVPDESLQRALCLAAMRGVEVTLILPRRSNHRLADFTRSRYLRELWNAGVRVKLVPGSMVHAKGLVVDDTLAIAGSANLDLRSLFLNFELVCLFSSEHDSQHLAAWLKALAQHSEDYSPAPTGRLHEIIEGLVLLLAYQL